MEGAEPFDKSDLYFINSLSNQLAVALDRDFGWRRDIQRRKEAEGLKRRYEALVDNLDRAFVWEADTHTYRFLYASAQIQELLGYSRERYLELESWMTLVHPDDRAAVQASFLLARAGADNQRCDHRAIDLSGRVHWLQTRIHLAGPESGQARLQGVSFDITWRKEAEARLREQVNFSKAIAGNLGEGVVAVDLEGRITFLNEAAEKTLGWYGKSAVGMPLGELTRVLAADGRSVESPVMDAMRRGERLSGDEHFFTRADAAQFPVHFSVAPIRREGDVTGAVLAFEDITERRHAEEMQRFLLEASRTLSATLDYQTAFNRIARLAVPQLGDLCFLDVLTDNTIQRAAWAHVNPEKQKTAAQLPRFTPSLEFSNHPVARVIRTGVPELLSNIDEPWMRAVAVSDAHFQFMRLEGVQSLIVVPLRLGERRLGALSLVFSDSGRRHTPSDLAVAEELALRVSFALENGRLYEQAQGAIGVREQILAVVAHDLRSPLLTIALNTNVLKRRGDEAVERRLGQEQSVARITRATARMQRLIEDLLDFASIESGRLAIKPRLDDPAAIVREAVVSFEAIAQQQSLRLTATAATGLPPVLCDHDRVLQVLSNLVGNAVKVVPAGGSITLYAEAREQEVVFSVTDSGPGIDEKDLPNLFERYWRSGKVTYKGTGLGLAISRGIVEAHGGRIWAESRPHQGATFFFTLPATPLPAPAG